MGNRNLNPFDRHSRVSDYILAHNFHLIDVSISLPIVLSLTYGFHSATSPNISVQLQKIKEGNQPYPSFSVIGAEVAPVTLEQGVSFFNSDFYDWVDTTIDGKPNRRRNLLLIQYSQIGIGSLSSPGANSLNIPALNIKFDTQFAADLISRVPARAWMMYGCLPVDYRAASDFNAATSEVSLASLTLQPQKIIEFSTGI